MAKVRDDFQEQIGREQSALEQLTGDYRFQIAQGVVDAAGIVDPTPISDLVGAGMSLASGDVVGAGLSLVSIVPYLGDALGKTAKGARLAKRMASLAKRIEKAAESVTKLRKQAIDGLKKQAAKIRAKRKAEAAKKAAAKKACKDCPAPKFDKDGNPYGTKLPKEGEGGHWSGDRGNSQWVPDEGTPLHDVTGGQGVRYTDGYPDFSPHVADVNGVPGQVEIPMRGDASDMSAADEAMRERLGDPDWTRPDGHTWHHTEDGVTMQLVPGRLNNPDHGGAAHTGGASIARDPDF